MPPLCGQAVCGRHATFRLLTHSEAIELAEYRGLPVPQQRREYSLAEIYNPDEASVREIKATHIGFFAKDQ
jgi:hypothetical protein